MFRPVPGRAFWMLPHVIVVIACTIAIVSGSVGLLGSAVLACAIGVSFSCLGILAHEILHGAVVETRWLRRLLGAVCLAPLNIGPAFWVIWHTTHHAHTQHPARDPDTWGLIDGAPQDRAMRFLRRFTNARSPVFPLLLSTGVTAHAAALLLASQPRMTRRQRVATLTEFLIPLVFWLGLGAWLGWVHYLFFYLIPLLIANLIINSFVVTNHFLNPLDDAGDPLASSLTVTTYGWIARLLLNFNYHAEHHLFPRMSSKYAPQLAHLLKELWPDRYHQMPHGQALLAVWRTPRVYYDRVRLIDLRDHALYGTLGHGLDPARTPAEAETPRAS